MELDVGGEADPFHALSVRQIKQLLDENKIEHNRCVEKNELVALAQQHNLREKAAAMALHRV